jgi:hypothetical protein
MIHFDCHTGWFMWWCFTCHHSTLFNISPRVNQLVTEHLSVQGRPDPREGSAVSGVKKKNWTSPHGASDTLTIVENGLEIKKLWPPKVHGVKN